MRPTKLCTARPRRLEAVTDPKGELPRIVLASGSARRRELLTREGLSFTVAPVDVPEDDDPRAYPTLAAFAESLALKKALACVARGLVSVGWIASEVSVALGADTVAVCPISGMPLGKAVDQASARRTLARLAGRWHEVVTGVALIVVGGARDGEVVTFSVTSRTWVTENAAHRERYLASGAWRGKAGAFGIQDPDTVAVKLEGDRDNVIGLPMTALLTRLSAIVGRGRGADGEDRAVPRADAAEIDFDD